MSSVAGTGPGPALRALARAFDAYAQLVSASRAAPLLSRPSPVRRSGFDIELRIVNVRAEAQDVVSLTFVAIDGGRLPAWTPGAHLDVFLPSGRLRQYSLCGDPADRSRYRIAVRRLDDGNGGSREVHDELRGQGGRAPRHLVAHGLRGPLTRDDAVPRRARGLSRRSRRAALRR